MLSLDKLQDRIQDSSKLEELEELRINLLGRQGELTLLLKSLKDLPADQRKIRGEELNNLKKRIEELIKIRKLQLEEEAMDSRLKEESIDVFLPPFSLSYGRIHILSRVYRKLENVFKSLGYEVVKGPEIESDYYNFEALNMPSNHPARDMWDTFYLENGFLLRTHTSPVQIRTMKNQKPPIKIVASGKCYRRDNPDASHSPAFNQLEGLYVDQGVSLSHLKGTLEFFARATFGPYQEIKLRTSYFPFVEPGLEVAVKCVICKGNGCATCKYTSWIEILGAGMVHPEVLERQNIDPNKFSGFAFGVGIDRVAMLMYGIKDIRSLFENDLRFLEQFKNYLDT